MNGLSKVWRIAHRARREFEERALPLPRLMRLYARYNVAVEAERFCIAAIDGFPRGACGLASLHLVTLLGRGEVVYGRFIDEGHTFVLLEDDVVVDITADQFGGPPVHVGPIHDPWHLPRRWSGQAERPASPGEPSLRDDATARGRFIR